jgi:hypothetical protein
MVKLFSAGLLAVIMAMYSTNMVRERRQPLREPDISATPTTSTTPPGERMAEHEVRLLELEHRMDMLERQKIGEQLAEIRARQEGVIALLIPVALFIFTHTYELFRRMTTKPPKRRSTD